MKTHFVLQQGMLVVTSQEMAVSVKQKVIKLAVRSPLFLFLFLLPLVLLVNTQVIQQDLMYPEQPVLYLVNQKIHSWSDLLAIYLHPKMLDNLYVPFFRPSGHFLLYQLIAPWLGWHNTRGLLVVNLVFLALVGVMLIKLYKLFFPNRKTGGYIAFAICLMHPLFLISRFTIMHFEYAGIFFLLASLYCFCIFCQKNFISITATPFHHYKWLISSILLYIVAATFKEVTIMLMPAMLVYLGIVFYPHLKQKQVLQLAGLLMAVGTAVTFYLSLAWTKAAHPIFFSIGLKEIVGVFNKYLKILFSFPYSLPSMGQHRLLWEINVFPWLDSLLMLTAMCLLPINAYRVIKNSTTNSKMLWFLYFCAGLFLLMPLAWNHAMPWHVGLTLVFLSLLMGHAFEDFFKNLFRTEIYSDIAAYVFAFGIALSTVTVNQINLTWLQQHPLHFNYVLNHNAIKHPPNLRNLNQDSVIIVEDRRIPYNDYDLGDSVYPFAWLGIADPHRLIKNVAEYYYPYVYGGTLFRWAYANTHLKEQVYPFRVRNMADIKDEEVIYNWLQHYDNIFCLGFDDIGQWHDKTIAFKTNLRAEQLRRHIIVNHYSVTPASKFTGRLLSDLKILAPDSMVCKQICDKVTTCVGFTYSNNEKETHCKFYQRVAMQKIPCEQCTAFTKETV